MGICYTYELCKFIESIASTSNFYIFLADNSFVQISGMFNNLYLKASANKKRKNRVRAAGRHHFLLSCVLFS